jgi:NAD(P)-dependent dehydrogenase (short-subunit alcohol dehydrogenase family)
MPQTWLITGSSRGLGRELAEGVLAAGHRLAATARDPRRVADLVDRYPDTARAVALDVTDRNACAAAIRAAIDAFGGLDVLVNNAGYANVNALEDFTEEDFRAQVETNLWGVINMSRAVLPLMREQGSGHIVQISSAGGRITAPGVGAYQTSKWAVEGFSSVLAQEVAPLGIHVTLVEPGGFRTDWAGASMTVHEIREEYRPTVGRRVERLRRGIPALGDPRKGAQAILQLAALPEPPLRLLLGRDAYVLVRASDEAKIASDERWKELTFSTDADDASGHGAAEEARRVSQETRPRKPRRRAVSRPYAPAARRRNT